ncbi:hypothetical protein DRE_01391 [Drechslerella stenobrocha 248]|uniref:Gfd2/YDR514C-like C-terminal domain-containing protein n=1 Tax=Drechslerella stenobrocha 248 TaxID=1043628 RepID=W7HLT2_9PEZI|nr:hypothetical protein DRE_01391 [Drechslerella stenobrocha 248]
MPPNTTAQKFCLLKTIRRWPYRKTSKASQAVLKRFFDKEPFFDRPWDIYVAESPESGSLGGVVVPFDQVKTFFELAQSETEVMLSTRDRDLALNLSGSSGFVFRFIGNSQSQSDYDSLLQTISGPDSRVPMPPISQPSGLAQPGSFNQQRLTKAAKSERRQAQLQNRLNMMKSAAEIVASNKDYLFLSVDIESWEKNHDIITELGLTRYFPNAERQDLGAMEKTIQSEHFIIKEHRSYKNGDYVADASGHFEFGESKYIPLANIKAAITSFTEPDTVPQHPTNTSDGPKDVSDSFSELALNSQRQLVLVGHDVNADIEYLRKLRYDAELSQFLMVFDTMEMWRAMADTPNGISLSRLCNELGIVAWNLHNAGNDARYTMNAFLEMALRWKKKTEPLDTQQSSEGW